MLLSIQSRNNYFRARNLGADCWYVRIDCQLAVWNGAVNYGLPVFLVDRLLVVILSKTYKRERQVSVFPTFDPLGKEVVFPLISIINTFLDKTKILPF